MQYNFIRKKVLNYINTDIKPLYKTFDKAHNISHFSFVTKNCVEYANELVKRGESIDLEIAYLVGALHDIGISKGREGHAKSSGEMVRKDKNLKEFYDEETIELIAEAVEDHSSHLEYEPRSIYGKIVADADRNNTLYLVFSRPIKFALKNEPQYSKAEHINRVYKFVDKKFGRNGYVKYWLDIPQTRKEQNAVWELLDNEKVCKAYISGIIDELTKGKML
ncbi:MAG: HD domain-containing protein [Clostridia bacterium]|nr:HD domain-containing protein [Clostridia bacterium]